jgi:hypothetical protein
VQAIHLHVCARLEASTALRMLSALLTTLPWWMDRRGGWTIVMKGSSTFSEIVDAEPKNGSTLSLLLSHVLHLHGLFHGLNITCALSHFAGAPEHGVVELAHFRLYWLSLVATSAADVMLQPLVDRKMLPPSAPLPDRTHRARARSASARPTPDARRPTSDAVPARGRRALPYLLGASVLPAVVLALPMLSEHVSFISTAASFALWWGREHRALSNLALALAFSQLYEIVALLAARYSLVDA